MTVWWLLQGLQGGSSRSEADHPNDEGLPPTYQSVLSQDYIQITVPVASELERMRTDMARRAGWRGVSMAESSITEGAAQAAKTADVVGTAAVAGISLGITETISAAGSTLHAVQTFDRLQRESIRPRSTSMKNWRRGRRREERRIRRNSISRHRSQSNRSIGSGIFEIDSHDNLSSTVGQHNTAFISAESMPDYNDIYTISHQPPVRTRTAPLYCSSVHSTSDTIGASTPTGSSNPAGGGHRFPLYRVNSLASSIDSHGPSSSSYVNPACLPEAHHHDDGSGIQFYEGNTHSGYDIQESYT